MNKYDISKEALQLFLDSGLTKDHAKKMQIRDVSSQELKKSFPTMPFNKGGLSGHEIPYFDLSGKAIGFVRYRIHGDNGNGHSKYLQVTGQGSRFYFPPFVDWKKIAADPSISIYITEGERKAAKACAMGFPCIGLGGVWNWTRKENNDGRDGMSQPIKDFQLIEWSSRKVIIVFDSDSQFNTSIQEAIRKLRDTLVRFGADPYRKDLPHKAGDNKVGLDDLLKRSGGRKAFEKIPCVPLLLNKTVTAQDLLLQKFDPVTWVIKGLIPRGLTILAGPPKVGKSWLVLELVLAIASGKKTLDHYEVAPMNCLYLALEDTGRRLKARAQALASRHTVNKSSSFAYEWERVENGGLLELERHLDHDPNCKVVFIDTFAKMRHIPSGRENLYHQDYEAVSTLKRIADKRGIGIVVVHHTKKGAVDDFLESVSGSMGLTGAADTIIVLRRNRNEDEGILQVTGRDVGEQEIAISFNKGLWTYKGDACAIQATETQKEVLDVIKMEGRPLRQKEIADLIGRKNGGFTKTLARMVRDGKVKREKNFYTVAEEQPKKRHKFAQANMDEKMEDQ